MRNYEIMVVIQADLDETTLQAVIEKINGWITDSGGTVNKTDLWGKRRLANKIRKQSEGFYMLINAQMAPEFTSELERNFMITEPVLRFLISNLN